MNLTKAVADNAPGMLEEIDARIAAILRELRDLQAKRVQIAMHLTVASLDAPAVASLADIRMFAEGE